MPRMQGRPRYQTLQNTNAKENESLLERANGIVAPIFAGVRPMVPSMAPVLIP